MLYKDHTINYNLNSDILYINVINNETNESYERYINQDNVSYKLTNIYNLFRSLDSRIKIYCPNKDVILESKITMDFNVIENNLYVICYYKNELMQVEYELELNKIKKKYGKQVEINLQEIKELEEVKRENLKLEENIIELEDKVIELEELIECSKLEYKDKIEELELVIKKNDYFIKKLMKENEKDEDVINEKKLIIIKQNKLIDDCMNKLSVSESKKKKNLNHVNVIKGELGKLEINNY